MEDKKLNYLMKDETYNKIIGFIPNEFGINLCSVNDIKICRQKNGEIKKITIDFLPENPEPKVCVGTSNAVLA